MLVHVPVMKALQSRSWPTLKEACSKGREDHLLDGAGDVLQDLAAVLGVPCDDRR